MPPAAPGKQVRRRARAPAGGPRGAAWGENSSTRGLSSAVRRHCHGMATETMNQARARFSEQGYQGQARREAGGIRFLDDGGLYLPEQVVVEGLARTDLGGGAGDGGVVFAIYSPKSARRATLALEHGHRLSAADSNLVTRLMATAPR